jgi:hypothetical protein
MNWKAWIRQGHRWASVAFTLAVIANFAVMGLAEPPVWVVYTPLPFLFVLLFSGLFMFAQPHVALWRTRRS